MNMLKLIVATTNRGKLREIVAVLQDAGVVTEGLDSHPEWVPAVEDGATFAQNARKKAQSIASQSGQLCLADDSGLVVDALDGRPGIYSARFAHANATDAENNACLLENMRGLPASQRSAAFVCAMALCTPSGDCRIFEGRLDGQILAEPRGGSGFGYDPLFWLPDLGKSLAEISLEEKNHISHRAQALIQVTAYLKQAV
ncbi:MAG: XTP/dITP diphosphatase [Desulfuromonadaceae bacterium]|nr:XTP/dITP diphosphatase [Desulfuromonadaceae bacterium]